jgi:hypothetical protein
MRLLGPLTLACCVVYVAFAASTIGTASSSATFDLNGVTMTPEGVSSWPITAGDELRAGAGPVIIRFQDGSRMTLNEQSRVRLVRNGNLVSVNLIGGDAQFSLAPASTLQILNLGRQVSGRSGTISSRGSARDGGGSRPAPRPDVPRVPPPPVSTQ